MWQTWAGTEGDASSATLMRLAPRPDGGGGGGGGRNSSCGGEEAGRKVPRRRSGPAASQSMSMPFCGSVMVTPGDASRDLNGGSARGSKRLWVYLGMMKRVKMRASGNVEAGARSRLFARLSAK